MLSCKNDLPLIWLGSHGHSHSLCCIFSLLFKFLVSHFPALVSLVTLCCSLLKCQDYSGYYIRWLVPVVRWKKELCWGRWAKLLQSQDKWGMRPTWACGMHFCCPSLLFLCCQWLFGLLKWQIFCLLRQSPRVIFQTLLRQHAPQVEMKKEKVIRLVNF